MINHRLFDQYGIDTRKDLGLALRCPRPFDTVLIDKRGSCYACECTAWLPQSIGNLQVRPLGDIAQSDMAQLLRSTILDGTYRYCNSAQCSYLLERDKDVDHAWTTDTPATLIRHLRLAIDDSCNLRCPSCRKSMTFHKEGAAHDLGIRLADRINQWLTEQTHGIQVHMGSDGDPFASHVYRHFMEHTPKRDNIRYSILTNGLMFKEFHTRVPEIIDNLDELGVSIDGASRDTYERLRLGGRWDKVMENLECISELRRRLGFRFTLHMVVQRGNYHEMMDMVEMGKALGADEVYLNRITDWNTLDDFAQHDVANPTHPDHDEFLKHLHIVKSSRENVTYATLE